MQMMRKLYNQMVMEKKPDQGREPCADRWYQENRKGTGRGGITLSVQQ
jgi:hypothetical protein